MSLTSLFSGLVDKEQVTKDTIQNALDNVAEELGLPYNKFFIMIQPKDSEMNFKCYIYKLGDKSPELVREITIKEIVNE